MWVDQLKIQSSSPPGSWPCPSLQLCITHYHYSTVRYITSALPNVVLAGATDAGVGCIVLKLTDACLSAELFSGTEAPSSVLPTFIEWPGSAGPVDQSQERLAAGRHRTDGRWSSQPLLSSMEPKSRWVERHRLWLTLSIVQYSIVAVLCCTMLYCTVLYCVVLYCTVITLLWFTVLFCTVLLCTEL